jgi:excinuclease ABC subunit C
MVHTVPEALLMEGKLIKDFRPRCNISFRDDKPFLLVKVDPREEWPRFRLTRIRSGDGSQYSRPATIPRARSAETGRKAISTRLDALRG